MDKTSHGDFSVIIENEITKEKLDIGFIHKNLKEGEKVEVYYLPHLKLVAYIKYNNSVNGRFTDILIFIFSNGNI